MITKITLAILCVMSSAKLFAFPCFFTLAKDSCWANYEVKVIVIDATTNKQILTIDLPKGKSWGRQLFTCEPAQRFYYQATYQPVFWQSEIGKTYKSIRYWSLPASIGPKETAWNIPVCFAANFAAVPLPPDAVGNCDCGWENIPPPPPQ
ncbi:periplasmic protein [Legionella lansingensis]|uniref:Periplasmic protein n=1 Tax=Legionella lansingensis TaxID=45067 RepID=A0A0W0W0G2_9GAMM|nr:hypothetical protein [Legionella lansingensis]KTD25725.1 periplasmic protein [Legionella lansingensis]SNV49268.1 periplasmic protein [Legionella lansingensis]